MADVRILHHCSCRLGHPLRLEDLYVCRECESFCCSFCVNQEIESYFCSNCLESVLASEAALLSNKCAKCFQCPVCSHTLSTIARGESTCFFACGFCRWNSLSAQLVAPKPEKLIVLALGLEKESTSFSAGTTDMIKLLQQMRETQPKSRRRFAITKAPVRPQAVLEKEFSEKASLVAPAVAATDLAYPADPLTQSNNLLPQRKPLLTRRSKRCGRCDKYVIRPDVNPSSAGLRIGHLARAAIPRITVFARPAPLRRGRWATVLLLVSSPVTVPVTCSLQTVQPEQQQQQQQESPTAAADDDSQPPSAAVRARGLTAAQCAVEVSLSAFDDIEGVDPPPPELRTLAVSEKDEPTDTATAATAAADGSAVVWQSQHRALVRVRVLPAAAASDARFTLQLRCTYTTETGRAHTFTSDLLIELGALAS